MSDIGKSSETTCVNCSGVGVGGASLGGECLKETQSKSIENSGRFLKVFQNVYIIGCILFYVKCNSLIDCII